MRACAAIDTAPRAPVAVALIPFTTFAVIDDDLADAFARVFGDVDEDDLAGLDLALVAVDRFVAGLAAGFA